jgi:hypothetical protein
LQWVVGLQCGEVDAGGHAIGESWAVITQLRNQWSDFHGFSPGIKNPLRAGLIQRYWPWKTRVLAGRMPDGIAARQSIGLGFQ